MMRMQSDHSEVLAYCASHLRANILAFRRLWMPKTIRHVCLPPICNDGFKVWRLWRAPDQENPAEAGQWKTRRNDGLDGAIMTTRGEHVVTQSNKGRRWGA